MTNKYSSSDESNSFALWLAHGKDHVYISWSALELIYSNIWESNYDTGTHDGSGRGRHDIN